MAELITQHGGSITANDLRRRSRRYMESADAEAALNDLAGRGWGTWEPTSTSDQGGRPTRRFRLTHTVSVSETPSNPEENGGLGYSNSDDEPNWDDPDAINRALAEAADADETGLDAAWQIDKLRYHRGKGRPIYESDRSNQANHG